MRILIAISLLALASQATPVFAQGQESEARARYLAGKALFDSQDYEGAVAEYRKSYELTKLPRLLLNIAQAYRLKGDTENALVFYQRFVAEQPPSNDAQDIQYLKEANEWIEQLGAELEQKRLQEKRRQEELARAKRAQNPPPLQGDAKPHPAPRSKTGAGHSLVSSPSSDVHMQAHRKSRLGPLGVAGITSAGVGVVALGIGGYFGLRAQNLESNLNSERTGWTDKQIDDFENGKTAERRMFMFTGVGAGLVVVGAGLFVFDWLDDRNDEARLTIAPTVDADRAGFSLSGTF